MKQYPFYDNEPSHPMDCARDHFNDDNAEPLIGPEKSVFTKKELKKLKKIIKDARLAQKKEGDK